MNENQREQEHVLMANDTTRGDIEKLNKMTSDTWLCDSAATYHLTHDSDGKDDVEEVQETVIISDGNGIQITKEGKLDVTIVQKDGTTCDTTIDTKVSPGIEHHYKKDG